MNRANLFHSSMALFHLTDKLFPGFEVYISAFKEEQNLSNKHVVKASAPSY